MALYARMSYNSNGWITPSGEVGKSISKTTHEFNYGFGFEEWFFNPRRFKDEHGKDCHFAYLDPLRRRQRPNEKNDLILYTLESDGVNVINRYIVARIPVNHWRYVDLERYNELIKINKDRIKDIEEDLKGAIVPNFTRKRDLTPPIIMERFKDQVCGKNEVGESPSTSRLWNIELIKPVNLLADWEKINTKTICPDSHIKEHNRFLLYDSESPNWNHEKCGRNI